MTTLPFCRTTIRQAVAAVRFRHGSKKARYTNKQIKLYIDRRRSGDIRVKTYGNFTRPQAQRVADDINRSLRGLGLIAHVQTVANDRQLDKAYRWGYPRTPYLSLLITSLPEG